MKACCRKCLLFFLCLLFLLSSASCSAPSFQLLHKRNEPEVSTNTYGREIPAYTNVDVSPFDPQLFVADENGRYRYADSSVASYTGIDVSTFQGEIDWAAVKNDGIDFAMLRVGYRGYGKEGKLGEDDRFRSNYENAKNAGIHVGVYFFSQATTPAEAAEEAEFVLNLIRDCEISYPVAYDWEAIDYDTARTDGMTTEQITDCAVAFCDTISKNGYPVLIYFNRELGYYNYDLSKVSSYHFWLAEYLEAPTFVYDYKIWQYSKEGTVAGINGSVDLNISLFDFSTLY